MVMQYGESRFMDTIAWQTPQPYRYDRSVPTFSSPVGSICRSSFVSEARFGGRLLKLNIMGIFGSMPKHYVWCINPFTCEICLQVCSYLQDLTLDQKTPIRVLHRRPLAVREKMIHGISATRVDDHLFTMLIRTGAGTYPWVES